MATTNGNQAEMPSSVASDALLGPKRGKLSVDVPNDLAVGPNKLPALNQSLDSFGRHPRVVRVNLRAGPGSQRGNTALEPRLQPCKHINHDRLMSISIDGAGYLDGNVQPCLRRGSRIGTGKRTQEAPDQWIGELASSVIPTPQRDDRPPKWFILRPAKRTQSRTQCMLRGFYQIADDSTFDRARRLAVQMMSRNL